MFNSAPSPKENWASLQKPFKLWEMKPLKNLAKWLMTFRSSPKAKLSQLDILAQRQTKPSGESLMVHQSLAVVKQGRLSYGFANQRLIRWRLNQNTLARLGIRIKEVQTISNLVRESAKGRLKWLLHLSNPSQNSASTNAKILTGYE
jgi:hypothetical protein